jgi:hypothetical protein
VQLANSNYTNWKTIVGKLATAATAIVFYRVDTSINKVAEAWAVISPSAPFIVYGNFGNQGPSSATIVVDFAAAVAITTSIGVSET